MIFNILGTSREENVYYDLRNLLSFIDSFCDELGFKSFQIDKNKLVGLLHLIRENFPHKDGIENANPFKKIAYFIVNFIAERPMETSFKDDFKINNIQLNTINNHQNAIIAYAIAVESLVNAEIFRPSGEKIKMTNKIKVSKHSYVDIIDALSGVTPSEHFKIIAVLFEQLAYRANPYASYAIEI